MKKLSFLLTLALLVSILAGCAGTPVIYYSNCTCPVEAHEAAPAPTQTPDVAPKRPHRKAL